VFNHIGGWFRAQFTVADSELVALGEATGARPESNRPVWQERKKYLFDIAEPIGVGSVPFSRT